MHAFRWWLFKVLCHIGWEVCPEPERTVSRYTYDKAVSDMKRDHIHTEPHCSACD